MAFKKAKSDRTKSGTPGFFRVLAYTAQWNLDFEVGEIVLCLDGVKDNVSASFLATDGQSDEFLAVVSVLEAGSAEATQDGGVIRATRWKPMLDASDAEIKALNAKAVPWVERERERGR